MIRVSSMRNRIPNLRRGAACALSLAFLTGVPLASPAQNTYSLPTFLPADSAGREGFLRIVNRSFQAGVVRIHAFDDTGERFGPVTLALDAEEAVHLTSRDLERGSAAKGLPEGIGDGSGWWRLALESDLALTPLAYVRTVDGFLTSMHDTVPEADGAHRVLFFNPGSNTSKASHLRIVNPGTTEAEVTVAGRDDAGDEASGTVRLTLPAGAARTLTAQELEAGGEGFDGSLGDGAGKWRLSVTSSAEIDVMSLLQTRTGHLSNVSTEPETPASGRLALPLVLPVEDGASREGFMRIVNRSGQAGTVSVTAIDDTGERFGPVTLELAAGGAVHLTSRDLERGSAAKGLPEGVGDGEGSWRLEFDSALDIVALGYVRTSDGFLTSMHDVVPVAEGTHRVLFFNPASNTSKASHLRIVNPGTTEAEVTVMGRDDAGDEASGTVRLTLPAGGARTLSAQQLEAGSEGFDGSLGDGVGKWRLSVTANRAIHVMSLLQSQTGHLSNVSTEPEMPPEGNPVTVPDAVPLALDGGTITGEIDSPDGAKYYTATIDEPGIFDFSASGDVVITVFDEQGNLVAQSATVAADAAQGEGKIGQAAVPVAVAVVYGAYKVHRYYVRIKKRNPGAGRVVFRLTNLYVRLAVRRLKGRIARTMVAYAGVADVDYDLDLAEFFEGESDAVVGNISVEPFRVDVPGVGSLTLLEFDTDHVLRVAHRKNRECGTGTDYSSEAAVRLRLAWTQQLPGGETKLITHPFLDFGEVRVTIARQNAPRRIGGARGSILVSVAAGASKTVDLSRYIEDPDGGALTFAVSDDEGIPAGWGVTTNGASLTFAASENAVNGEMFVTATDPARECWNFPVRLTVGSWECELSRHSEDTIGCKCLDRSNPESTFAPDWIEHPLASCPPDYDRCFLYTGGYSGYEHQEFAGSCNCYDGPAGLFWTNPLFFRRVPSCPPPGQ